MIEDMFFCSFEFGLSGNTIVLSDFLLVDNYWLHLDIYIEFGIDLSYYDESLNEFIPLYADPILYQKLGCYIENSLIIL